MTSRLSRYSWRFRSLPALRWAPRSSSGGSIARYKFEVVVPEDYNFPKPLPPNAILRAADASR